MRLVDVGLVYVGVHFSRFDSRTHVFEGTNFVFISNLEVDQWRIRVDPLRAGDRFAWWRRRATGAAIRCKRPDLVWQTTRLVHSCTGEGTVTLLDFRTRVARESIPNGERSARERPAIMDGSPVGHFACPAGIRTDFSE